MFADRNILQSACLTNKLVSVRVGEDGAPIGIGKKNIRTSVTSVNRRERVVIAVCALCDGQTELPTRTCFFREISDELDPQLPKVLL